MRELALHVLDLVQNSLRAGARLIEVEIMEDTDLDSLVITIRDDGCGMEPALLERALDPFTTTRTTRKVGLGLPLLKMAAERSGGELLISSNPGQGTEVIAIFQHSHIDRMPLGDMVGSMLTVIISNPTVDVVYRHRVNDRVWDVDTRIIKAEVGEDALTLPVVIQWLRSYLGQGESYLYGGATSDEVFG
ncbi:MAG: ATP-binding protein [Firmicutes bacterium]|jgi:nitrogen fixation/metabolism regulation signal transduction histidine kinase|nr:ATP-binding protein [Bacillota bacterium]